MFLKPLTASPTIGSPSPLFGRKSHKNQKDFFKVKIAPSIRCGFEELSSTDKSKKNAKGG